jgi:N-methylhydantoinase A
MDMARVGVDIGGTFTDVVLWHPSSGGLWTKKVPTTPQNPAEGALEGVLALLTESGLHAAEVDFLGHGTTVATNMMIEGTGARTALVCTRGFRDILEIRNLSRPPGYLYDLRCELPPPLVPRRLRLEVRERLDYRGSVVEKLDAEEVDRVAERLVAADVESVAVCLLFSFLNPEHERLIRERLLHRRPDWGISLSSDLLPEFREYPRTSTTVVNAYIAPRVNRYVARMETDLQRRGIGGRFFIMQSNGGLAVPGNIIRSPVTTLLSGPSGGAIACRSMGRQLAIQHLVNVDMGGTSFDVSLVVDGECRTTSERTLNGAPVRTPMLDIHTIGAGGGSIAWVDNAGRFRVGPRSAGSQPGPACYGRGGTEATVTDANLVLGYLSPDGRLSGAVSLDLERAKAACAALGTRLELDVPAVASGIHRIVNTSMVGAIRTMLSGRGLDPRDFALVAFGGAGPLHAAELAVEMDIPRVLVPPVPGCHSAMGILMTDAEHHLVQSHVMNLAQIDLRHLETLWGALEARGRELVGADGVAASKQTFRRSAELRYVGQDFPLAVTVAREALDVARLEAAFHEAHQRTYGFHHPHEAIELVNVRLHAVGELPKLAWRPLRGAEGTAPDARRRVHFVRHGWIDTCPVVTRAQLAPGVTRHGPLLVEQPDTTTVVPPDFTLRVDSHGIIRLDKVDAHGQG